MNSLKTKLLFLTIVPFMLAIIIISGISYLKTSSTLSETLISVEQAIIKEKQILLKNELMVAKSLIDTVIKNSKDLKTAREEVINLLTGVRYLEDKSGYFFAYEKREDGYYFGFHPANASLNNKKTDISKPDIKGYAFREDLIKYAKDEKYINYYYKQPSSDTIMLKMASSIYIPEFNWTLVTGIYADDIEKQIIVLSDHINEQTNELLMLSLSAMALLIISCFITVIPTVNALFIKPIEEFQNGLKSFFLYLNKEAKTVNPIRVNSKDELGQMTKIVNENIIKVQEDIEEDRKLIDDTIVVLEKFQNGDLSQRLATKVRNPALVQLKSVLNNMAEHLESNIDATLSIIEQYSQYNYLQKVETQGLQKHLLNLATGVNTLGVSTTQMLVENQSNGVTLQKSSNTLLANVDKLNQSSNEAATSLEQTAAALEEITSNIRNNTQNIAKMATLSSGVTSSAQSGEKLANDTTLAMEEINEQVSSINEAIAVIDQIAFQTNILSLNAAVEAATAGEAGKGFAVVAAEVRNLATRSADAAKEIKIIVEQATSKANDGKSIASNMINGYEHLNENILQTIELIKDIENSSNEQLLGIEQINDAVSRLDLQTQENASIASTTKEVASTTDDIANLIVQDVNKKEFNGKNDS